MFRITLLLTVFIFSTQAFGQHRIALAVGTNRSVLSTCNTFIGYKSTSKASLGFGAETRYYLTVTKKLSSGIGVGFSSHNNNSHLTTRGALGGGGGTSINGEFYLLTIHAGIFIKYTPFRSMPNLFFRPGGNLNWLVDEHFKAGEGDHRKDGTSVAEHEWVSYWISVGLDIKLNDHHTLSPEISNMRTGTIVNGGKLKTWSFSAALQYDLVR